MAANELQLTRGQMTRNPTNSDGLLMRDVAPEIYKKAPNRACLIHLMMSTQRVIDDNRKVEWLEQDLDPRFFPLGAITAGAGTTGTVALTDAIAAQLKAGQTISRDRTTVMHITAMVYTTGAATMTLDVITGLVAGDQVCIGGGVVQENSAEPTAITRLPAFVTNQMATVRDAWGYSNWVATDSYYGGKTRQWHSREDALLQHKIGLEVEAWNGSATATQLTLSGANIVYQNGVFAQVTSNVAVLPPGGLTTWETLTSIAQGYDRLMEASEPYMFVSRKVMSILDIIAFQKTTPSDFVAAGKEFGLSCVYIRLGQKRYKCFVIDNFQFGYGNLMICGDPKQISLRTVKDQATGARRWMFETLRGMDVTGADGTTGCLTSDMCVKVENEQGFFIVDNIQTA